MHKYADPQVAMGPSGRVFDGDPRGGSILGRPQWFFIPAIKSLTN